jgi:hypothetical protein
VRSSAWTAGGPSSKHAQHSSASAARSPSRDNSELLAAYGPADVVVMPGTAELQSLAMLDAMAAGRPAGHRCRCHGARPPDTERRERLPLPPGDVAALAERLAQLIIDPVLRQRLGRHSRRIADQYSLARTLTAFEECYADPVRTDYSHPEPTRILAADGTRERGAGRHLPGPRVTPPQQRPEPLRERAFAETDVAVSLSAIHESHPRRRHPPPCPG